MAYTFTVNIVSLTNKFDKAGNLIGEARPYKSSVQVHADSYDDLHDHIQSLLNDWPDVQYYEIT